VVNGYANLIKAQANGMNAYTPDLGKLVRDILAPFKDSALPFTVCDATRTDLPLVSINAAFTELTGYNSRDAIGRSCLFMNGIRTDPRAVSKVRRDLAAGRPAFGQLLNYRSDGSVFLNELVLTPIRDMVGILRFYTCLQREVQTSPIQSTVITICLPDVGNLRGADAASDAWLAILSDTERARLAHACKIRSTAGTVLKHVAQARSADGLLQDFTLVGHAEMTTIGVIFRFHTKEGAPQMALMERLRLLETVSVQAWDGIIITEAAPLDDPGPRILYANDSITRHTGFPT